MGHIAKVEVAVMYSLSGEFDSLDGVRVPRKRIATQGAATGVRGRC